MLMGVCYLNDILCLLALFLKKTLGYTIVIRGHWLGKPANIKVENNGAAVYV